MPRLALLAPLLLLLVLAPEAAAKKRRHQTAAATRKRRCEREDCANVHEDGMANCVLKCESPACYAEVYAADELEPGEIDVHRQRLFSKCVGEEARAGRARPAKPTSSGGAAAETAEATAADAGEL